MEDWPSGPAVRAMREALSRQDEILGAAMAASRGVPISPEIGDATRAISKQLEGMTEKFAEAGLMAGMTPAAMERLTAAFAKTTLGSAELERLQKITNQLARAQALELRYARFEALEKVSKSIDAAFASQALDTRQFVDALARIRVPTEVVVDVDAGFDDVIRPVLADDAPEDGLAGIPRVLDHLSDDRRRELRLSVATLLVMTALYIRALATDQAELEAVVGALLAAAWCYASVMNALDDVERTLDDDRDQGPQV